jgi:hypothetical protein
LGSGGRSLGRFSRRLGLWFWRGSWLWPCCWLWLRLRSCSRLWLRSSGCLGRWPWGRFRRLRLGPWCRLRRWWLRRWLGRWFGCWFGRWLRRWLGLLPGHGEPGRCCCPPAPCHSAGPLNRSRRWLRLAAKHALGRCLSLGHLLPYPVPRPANCAANSRSGLSHGRTHRRPCALEHSGLSNGPADR